MIKIGNFEDNLDWLAPVDWVSQVVVENLEIKQDLLAKVEKAIPAGKFVEEIIPIEAFVYTKTRNGKRVREKIIFDNDIDNNIHQTLPQQSCG